MAVLAIFTGRGVTTRMYDDLRADIDWEHRKPPGAVFHATGVDAAGELHVADVWESKEALDAFIAARLTPAFRKLHIPPPDVEFFDIYNATAFDAVDRYKV
ncbi:MAG: hypothetical protein JWO72_1792 [Caulobacteraceae bacterium]|jgi:hypothetical protein|nr:hypothetical protein [Caulobacteraceae bacterium]